MSLAEPSSIHERAAEHPSSSATRWRAPVDLPPCPDGGVLAGVSAIGQRLWLVQWLTRAAGSACGWRMPWWRWRGVVAMTWKARRVGVPLNGTAARRFAWAFLPAIGAAVLLTAVLLNRGLIELLPGCWLLLYGAAVASGGALSVRLVPAMGLCLMSLGVVAFAVPASWANVLMASGFVRPDGVRRQNCEEIRWLNLRLCGNPSERIVRESRLLSPRIDPRSRSIDSFMSGCGSASSARSPRATPRHSMISSVCSTRRTAT
jgi:hypothetical protein